MEEAGGSIFYFLTRDKFLAGWRPEVIALAVLAGLILMVLGVLATRKLKFIPQGLQNLLEMIIEWVSQLVVGIMGPEGKNFVPLLVFLFLYILLMNLMGLFPGLQSPTANLNITLSLAIVVFFTVHYFGFRKHGIWGYILHLAGSPKIEWGGGLLGIFTASVQVFVHILMFFLHIIGALGGFAILLSLSVRLFGNIFGKETVLYNFNKTSLVFLPFSIFITLLAILLSLIQALIFVLLTTIYITIAISGEETEGGGEVTR